MPGGRGSVVVLAGITMDELTVRPVVLCLKETDLVFPIGTVLKLTTGEVGVVVRRGSLSSEPNRPVVKLILDRSGTRTSEGRLIDLGEADPDTGEFAYSVAEALSCADLGINLRDHLMPA